jgi:ZIP family zinc transporter
MGALDAPSVHATLVVFLYALATALATGLGALPFALVRRVSPTLVSHANAIAAGLMLGASFGLVAEGTHYGMWQVLAGGVVGVAFILGTQEVLAREEFAFGAAKGADARRMVMIVVVMTVHSFAEGAAVGVSFGGGMTFALVVVVAIAVHNIPEGLAISAVLRPRGTSLLACAGWSIASSLPQPMMAVPAYLLVETFRSVMPYGIGFAAGAMVFMVFEELLPDAYDQARRPRVALLVSLTLVAMMVFQQYL